MECISIVSVFSIGASAEAQYSRLLTPYAAKIVREQLENRTKVKMVDGKVTTVETSLDRCLCKFHETMKLPCKYIFAFCESSHQPLFEERLAHNRWRLDNYKSSHEVFNVGAESCIENNDASVIVSTNKIHQPQPKTQHQKYNAAQLLALRVAKVISEAGSKEFDNKMSILKKVLQCWENGKSVCVIGKEAAANDEFIEELECEDNTDGPSEDITSHENKSDISLDNESGAAGDDEDDLNNLTLEVRQISESLFSVQEIIVYETGNIEKPNVSL